MTKEKAEKILPVIQAIINGQKIQVNINNRWEDVDENHNCTFLPESYEYRIKPEPKFRPFANAEECCQEMMKHQPFGWVKIEDLYRNIANVTICSITFADNEERDVNYEQAFKNYTFSDGMPFGVKVEE